MKLTNTDIAQLISEELDLPDAERMGWGSIRVEQRKFRAHGRSAQEKATYGTLRIVR